MNILQANLLSELSGFLKYGITGLGAIILLLSYFLLRSEQGKTNKKQSTIYGTYFFMTLGLTLFLSGLLVQNDTSQQKSDILIEGSNKNVIGSMQSKGDSAVNQKSTIKLNQSDSNKIQSIQNANKDTLSVK